ncbi:nucleoside-diphosphate kinase [Nonomuraea sp. NPDC046802]|uniref:nucleoside-diphosphate kinase n=1 Tax=Nonomuraea sp. NPDC046802 TaxID=3154919 RepID=UPI0034037B5F
MGSIAPDTWLTVLEDKRRLYAEDTYFVETWEEATRLLGDRSACFCDRHTLLVVKPEALLSGQLPAILHWLHENDWRVVAVRRLTVGRHEVRGLWRYHWNCVTQQHKDLVDMLFSVSESLLLMLRTSGEKSGAATPRLARGKGPAFPGDRAPGQLRAMLGNLNSYLTFVHSPDEPADFLRELGILLPPGERTTLLREDLAEVPKQRILEVADECISEADRWCDLSLVGAVARLAQLCARRGAAGQLARRAVEAAVHEAAVDRWAGDWRPLRDELAALDPGIAHDFAFIVLASYLTLTRLPREISRIPTLQGRVGHRADSA